MATERAEICRASQLDSFALVCLGMGSMTQLAHPHVARVDKIGSDPCARGPFKPVKSQHPIGLPRSSLRRLQAPNIVILVRDDISDIPVEQC
jgi:hypothetical protein